MLLHKVVVKLVRTVGDRNVEMYVAQKNPQDKLLEALPCLPALRSDT